MTRKIRAGLGVALCAALAATGVAAHEETPPLPWTEGILGEAEPLHLRDARMDVHTDGPAYQATLELTFRNVRSSTVEGVAFLPIAAGSVERGFVTNNNGILMEGQVRSRDRVIRVYRDITRPPPRAQRRRGGNDPVILERIDDQWLRATIAPVAANATVTMTISYLGLADTLGDLHAVHLPMPQSRGERGGSIAYALSGSIAASSDALSFLAPGQNVRRLDRTAEGHAFELSAPTSHTGMASLYYGTNEAREPVSCSCFRSEGEDGYFLMEYDPQHLLAQPLDAASYVLVLDLPGNQRTHVKALKRSLGDFVRQLGAGDRLALLSTDLDASKAKLVSAHADNRLTAIQRLEELEQGRRSDLSEILVRAADLVESSHLPARVLVVSANEGSLDLGDALSRVHALGEASNLDTALFTLTLGDDTNRDGIDKLARFGYGRAFHSPNALHVEAVASTTLHALRRPVLRHPRIEVAGASEVCIDPPRSLTFGDTVRLTGRYHSGGTSLVRVRGEDATGLVDEVYGAVFAQSEKSAPWVATLWASQRADQLRAMQQSNASDEDLRFFETRLCERFGLIGPNTVAFGLEQALVARMPRLIGPGGPDADGGAQVPDSPFLPMGPRPERRPGGGSLAAGEAEDRRERSLGNALKIGGTTPTPAGTPGGAVRGASPGTSAPAAAPRGAPRAAPRGRGPR